MVEVFLFEGMHKKAEGLKTKQKALKDNQEGYCRLIPSLTYTLVW